MTKSQLAYLVGLLFISISLIPITKNIFSVKDFNDAPILFLLGSIWLLFLIVFLYSSRALKKSKF